MTKYILFPLRACDMIPPSIDDQITSRGLINCARTVDGRRKVLLCYVSSPVIAIVLFCQRFNCLYVFLPLSSLYASVHAISNNFKPIVHDERDGTTVLVFWGNRPKIEREIREQKRCETTRSKGSKGQSKSLTIGTSTFFTQWCGPATIIMPGLLLLLLQL